MEVNYGIIHNPIAGGSKQAATDIEYAKKCLDDLNLSYKFFETAIHLPKLDGLQYEHFDKRRLLLKNMVGISNIVLMMS